MNKKNNNLPKGFKESSVKSVKCVRFFSVRHPATGDMVQERSKVEKRWTTILKRELKGLVAKFDLTGTKFFNNYNLDFAFTSSDGITYRVYGTDHETATSAGYAVQIMKK